MLPHVCELRNPDVQNGISRKGKSETGYADVAMAACTRGDVNAGVISDFQGGLVPLLPKSVTGNRLLGGLVLLK